MYSKKIKEFAQACGDTSPTPQLLNQEQIEFLKQMITDELEELQSATSLVDQADALIDIVYYVIHSASKHGYDLDPIFEIVHDANMKKIVNGKVLRREDGKILKPKGWQAPEPLIAKEIDRQLQKNTLS